MMHGDGSSHSHNHGTINPVQNFIFTVIVGLATTLGCLVLLIPSGVKDERILNCSLIFAASVMIYVSLVDLLHHAEASFEGIKDTDGHQLYSEGTVELLRGSFFIGGCILTLILDKFVHKITGDVQLPSVKDVESAIELQKQEKCLLKHEQGLSVRRLTEKDLYNNHDHYVDHQHNHNCQHEHHEHNHGESCHHKEERLQSLSLMTFLAIAIHNIPEGLATFLTTDVNNMNLSVPIAMAVHNIPEGIAVAIPTYLATKSYKKCIINTTLAGMGNAVGGLIGWILTATIWSGEEFPPFVHGALYGITAGIMVTISFMELLPEAYVRDAGKNHTLMAVPLILGMALMQGTIIALGYCGGHSH